MKNKIIEKEFGEYICHYEEKTYKVLKIRFSSRYTKTVKGVSQFQMFSCKSKKCAEKRAIKRIKQIKSVNEQYALMLSNTK